MAVAAAFAEECAESTSSSFRAEILAPVHGTRRARLLSEHHAILGAIRAGRHEEAAKLTERHMRGFREQHLGPN